MISVLLHEKQGTIGSTTNSLGCLLNIVTRYSSNSALKCPFHLSGTDSRRHTLRPSAWRTLTADWLLQWRSLQRLATGHAWVTLGHIPALCRPVKQIQSTLFFCSWDWGRVAVKLSERPMKLILNASSSQQWSFRSVPFATNVVLRLLCDQRVKCSFDFYAFMLQ